MTGSFSKTIFFCVTIMIIVSFLERLSAEMNAKTINLPKAIGVWSRPDSARIVDSSNIFKYMNGAGELYLSYGFDHLEAYEYNADQQDSILIEVYFMKTSNDAFGLLSLDWGGEPVPIHSRTSSQANANAAPARALYGGGLLRIWADTIYARVMAYRETTESKAAVLSLARSIAAQRKMSDEPALLAVLPQAIGSDWKLRKDRIGYFRSHLVLNSLYYLSHQNIFHLGHSTEAVISSYEQRSNTISPKRVQVLFVKYTTAEQAQKALDSFHTAYLHEHPKGFNPGATSKHTNFFSIEDGWIGYALSDNALCVVFECPNQECARLFIKHISRNVINKENAGGK